MTVRKKKPRRNYRRGTRKQRLFALPARLQQALKLLAGIITLAAMTAFFILVYDLLTQSPYFAMHRLRITGTMRLTENQVIRRAGIQKGDNILALNLALIKKRLETGPWIARAEISRQIPDGLTIRIREHRPLAIVDVGARCLINQHGKIFKSWEASDPADLPLIQGLQLSDLRFARQAHPGAHDARHDDTLAFESVMQVLRLAQQRAGILPIQFIRRIQVDRQTGLTVYAYDRRKAIILGYNDYQDKYNMLARLLAYFRGRQPIVDFDRIDLSNLQRVVVNPIKFDRRQTGS